jgi:hypothetical protein
MRAFRFGSEVLPDFPKASAAPRRLGLHFGNEVLPDFSKASAAPRRLGLHFGNEMLPDFSKVSAAPCLPLSLHFDNEVLPDFSKLTGQQIKTLERTSERCRVIAGPNKTRRGARSEGRMLNAERKTGTPRESRNAERKPERQEKAGTPSGFINTLV